ncbi:type IV pilus assembly protein PilE [Pseudomonas asplenii]|uniref:Type IV pilus assembly protein PilE n=2 Tax=Pseudomonas asplenii TaxID=53407 RepID=A0A1H6MRH1_9PSED|nr:type IV pilus assembly protein PilE [Pseudomonas fuscovaginae]
MGTVTETLRNSGIMRAAHGSTEHIGQTSMKHNSAQSGFTLVELMVTVVVVAILAAIALPAYSSYISRSSLKAAQADLVALSLNLENTYQKQLVYPTATASGVTQIQCVLTGSASSCTTNPSSGWKPSQQDKFTYSLTSTATTYTVTATGINGDLSNCTITLGQATGKPTTNSSCSYN